MSFLNFVVWGNRVQQWLLAAALMIVLLLVFFIARAFLRRRLMDLSRKTNSEFSPFFISLVDETGTLFLVVMAVYLGMQSIVFSLQTQVFLRVVVTIVFLLQLGFWVNSFVSFFIARRVKHTLAENADNATAISAMGVVLKGFVWSIVVLLVLDNIPGVQVTTLLASLGIGGIAIGLAVQNILSDLFASLSIALDKPFVIGDFITVGEFSGTVEHVGLKSTRVRSIQGEQLIFGNNDLLSSRIRNFKRMARRRAIMLIAVTYQTPHEKLASIPDIIRQVVKNVDEALIYLDRVHLKEFGTYSINYEVVYFVESSEYIKYMDLQQAINLEIHRIFEQEEIEFAYPTQSILIKNQT
jgi:small-conductance mechanosensitive channel